MMLRASLLLFLVAFFAIPSFATEDAWYKAAPQCVIPGANPQRTNYYNEVVDLIRPIVKWHVIADTSLPPVCYDNMIFMAGPEAFDAETGKKLWGHVKEVADAESSYSAHQVYKDKLYELINYGGQGTDRYFSILYIYQLLSGKLIKKIELSNTQSALLVYNDKIYMGGNGVICIDAKTFQNIWKLPATYVEQLVTDGRNLYYTDKAKILSVTLDHGKINWSYFNKKESAYFPLSYEKNYLFIASSNYLYVINANNGSLFKSYPVKESAIAGFLSVSPQLTVIASTVSRQLILFSNDEIARKDNYFKTAKGRFVAFIFSRGKLYAPDLKDKRLTIFSPPNLINSFSNIDIQGNDIKQAIFASYDTVYKTSILARYKNQLIFLTNTKEIAHA